MASSCAVGEGSGEVGEFLGDGAEGYDEENDGEVGEGEEGDVGD